MKDENSGSNYSYVDRPKKLNNTGIFFLITTLIFLGAGIYLFASSMNKTKEANTLHTELASSETRYEDLDSKYSNVLAEIESYKGKNAALDSVLSAREKFITDLRSNLNSERKKRKISDAEYKTQLASLNTVVTEMNSKIEELQKQNSILIIEKLGRLMGISPDQISVKATTNEQMGFIGRKEGVAAYAIALIFQS